MRSDSRPPTRPPVSIFDLESRAQTQDQLQGLVDALTSQNKALSAELAAAEQASSELVKLYVAHERLHAADTRADAYTAIDEIAGAVIGCEEFAVVGTDGDGEPVCLFRGPLLEATSFESLPCAQADIRRALATRSEPVVNAAAQADEAPRVSALVPLVYGQHTIAVLVLYRMLPQKFSFEPLDGALIGILATYAGKTLHATALMELARAGIGG